LHCSQRRQSLNTGVSINLTDVAVPERRKERSSYNDTDVRHAISAVITGVNISRLLANVVNIP